jgi:two-component system, chemotaxis family, protein-glutamate methylesterase/glutaminase
MATHDIIVIGTSAGGLKALKVIVAKLPTDLNGSIFIVQHVSADQTSFLPQILRRGGVLPATHAKDMEPFQKSRIYVAPPDYHLLVNRGHLRVVRGPRENRFRPSVDALFRSAARAYGSRVVGVILTGYLDDGTVGLQIVSKCGGVAIVQDPHEAEYPSMPESALQCVKPDYRVPLAEIPILLTRLVHEPAIEEKPLLVPKEIEIESKIAEQKMSTSEFLENVEEIGTRTTYTCPECSGTLWQIGEEEPLRFRCHTGHAFTANTLIAEVSQHLENALWSAVRALEEKATFSRQMAARMKNRKSQQAANDHEKRAEMLDGEVSIIRELILNGYATKRNIETENGDQQSDQDTNPAEDVKVQS